MDEAAGGPGDLRYRAAGDQHLVVELADVIDAAVNRRVVTLARQLERLMVIGVEAVLPTYRSILIKYDPLMMRRSLLETIVSREFEALDDEVTDSGQSWTIPVIYGGVHGPDLDDVAARHGLTTGEVIARHAGATYRVFMIGFAPGYAYLGGLSPTLHTPRRATARLRVAAGTISIGGTQASVASVPLPTAWNLLGRTPVKAFDQQREHPCLFAAGDTITFDPVDQREFDRLEAGIASGSIEPGAFQA